MLCQRANPASRRQADPSLWTRGRKGVQTVAHVAQRASHKTLDVGRKRKVVVQ